MHSFRFVGTKINVKYILFCETRTKTRAEVLTVQNLDPRPPPLATDVTDIIN